MATDHVRALIAEHGTNVHRLAEAAGLGHRLVYLFKSTKTTPTTMPETDLMLEMAKGLGCDPLLVIEAFAKDVGLPWGPPLEDGEERDLLRRYRRLSASDRQTLQRVADSLAGGPL